jgi:hypothetical protein
VLRGPGAYAPATFRAMRWADGPIWIACTKEGQGVLRSNVDPDTLRSIGKDIIEIADEITRQPTEGDTTY